MNEIGELEAVFTDLYYQFEVDMSVFLESCKKTGTFYAGEMLKTINPDLYALEDNTNKALIKLMQFSRESETYSSFCDFETYMIVYEKELEKFISQYKDSVENDFIEQEIRFYNNLPSDFTLVSHLLEFSCKRKIEFLNLRQKNDVELSNTTTKRKPLTNLETVFLLKQLGVLKHLTDNGYPQTKIAEIIGKILGKNPQGSRELLGKIEFPEKFGQKQQSDFQRIEDFLNSL
ncbi:MAG: hypothetical protein ABNH00_05890 [Dokdonia sp.]|jgi:hypothetical protein